MRMHRDLVLRGDDFILRPWTPHEAGWYVSVRDKEIFKWTTESRDLTVEVAEEALRSLLEKDESIALAIADSRDNRLLGNIALSFIEEGEAEAMYWLAPEARGRGIATKSLALLCKWAFETLNLRRITLQTRPGNFRSQQVAERCEFRRIVDPQHEGESSKTVWFELLPAANGKT